MAAQGTSLKSYVLTRLALVLPMVWILLTMVFLRSRRRSEGAFPGPSSSRSGTVSASTSRS
jgi:hypothetical protein